MEEYDLWCYLQEAAQGGNFEVFDYLIASGVDLHEMSDTIMPLTARRGQVEMFNHLLKLAEEIFMLGMINRLFQL